MTEHDVRPAHRRDLALIAGIEDSGLAVFEAALGDLTGDPFASPAPSGTERAALKGHGSLTLTTYADLPADLEGLVATRGVLAAAGVRSMAR